MLGFLEDHILIGYFTEALLAQGVTDLFCPSPDSLEYLAGVPVVGDTGVSPLLPACLEALSGLPWLVISQETVIWALWSYLDDHQV